MDGPGHYSHMDGLSIITHSGQTVIGLFAHQPRILQILLRYLYLLMLLLLECCSLARKQSWHLSPCVGTAYAKLFMKTEPATRETTSLAWLLTMVIETGNTLTEIQRWFSVNKAGLYIQLSNLIDQTNGVVGKFHSPVIKSVKFQVDLEVIIPFRRVSEQQLPLILSYQSKTLLELWKLADGFLWKFRIDSHLHMWQSRRWTDCDCNYRALAADGCVSGECIWEVRMRILCMPTMNLVRALITALLLIS